jgi:hypothetical protein
MAKQGTLWTRLDREKSRTNGCSPGLRNLPLLLPTSLSGPRLNIWLCYLDHVGLCLPPSPAYQLSRSCSLRPGGIWLQWMKQKWTDSVYPHGCQFLVQWISCIGTCHSVVSRTGGNQVKLHVMLHTSSRYRVSGGHGCCTWEVGYMVTWGSLSLIGSSLELFLLPLRHEESECMQDRCGANYVAYLASSKPRTC